MRTTTISLAEPDSSICDLFLAAIFGLCFKLPLDKILEPPLVYAGHILYYYFFNYPFIARTSQFELFPQLVLSICFLTLLVTCY